MHDSYLPVLEPGVFIDLSADSTESVTEEEIAITVLTFSDKGTLEQGKKLSCIFKSGKSNGGDWIIYNLQGLYRITQLKVHICIFSNNITGMVVRVLGWGGRTDVQPYILGSGKSRSSNFFTSNSSLNISINLNPCTCQYIQVQIGTEFLLTQYGVQQQVFYTAQLSVSGTLASELVATSPAGIIQNLKSGAIKAVRAMINAGEVLVGEQSALALVLEDGASSVGDKLRVGDAVKTVIRAHGALFRSTRVAARYETLCFFLGFFLFFFLKKNGYFIRNG